MDFLGDILGGLTSVASGGLFGLLGSIVGVGAKWLQEKQRQAWEEKKWGHETKMLELQMQARAAETEQELAIVSQQGTWDGLRASHVADAALSANVHKFVNDVRALFRPILTMALWGLSIFVFWQIVSAFGGEANVLAQVFTNAEINEIMKYMVYTVFFCASTATTWWFGDRAFTPPGMRGR